MTRSKDRMHEATDFIRKVIADPDAYPQRFVSIPMDPDMVATVLSRERTRLVRFLLANGPSEDLHALADDLERNYASVSRDVGVLVDMGLLRTERVGRSKRITATGVPVIVS